jgi:hypothetical protein
VQTSSTKKKEKKIGLNVYFFLSFFFFSFSKRILLILLIFMHSFNFIQYMHQMLAKQHQLKIMKQAGKNIEDHYRKNKSNNKDDFHSFEALCVQLEASRLSLEAIYDDIFASQHRILAQMKQVDPGNMTNYSIPSKSKENNKQQPSMKDPTKREPDDDDALASAMDILSSPKHSPSKTSTTVSSAAAIRAIPTLRTTTNTTTTTTTISAVKRSSQDGKSARERRREIEKKRLARPSGQHRSYLSPGSDNHYGSGGGNSQDDLQELEKARNRMRQLEAKAMTERQNSPTTKVSS